MGLPQKTFARSFQPIESGGSPELSRVDRQELIGPNGKPTTSELFLILAFKVPTSNFIMWSRSTLLRSRYSDIPDYLLPSFANAPRPRPFSASTRSHSRIGATPLPIPDGVELTLLGPLPLRKGEQRRIEPPSVIEVGGPLGTPLCLSRPCTTGSKIG